jgi:DMSO/TMAO reductase YedYZ molybdopterin-dependent catalytic subunit
VKLVFTKTLLNNIYTVNLAVEEVEDTDTALFADFGEPSINIGGEIKSGATTLATLPANFRKVVSQMPVVMRFADKDYSNNAKAVAEAWVLTVEGRINTEMTTIRAKTDDFSGPEEFII